MIRLNDFITIIASGKAGSNISNPFDCDVYLIDTGEGLVLVDSGVGPNDNSILNSVRACGHHPSDLRRILLTHGHADHSGNAKHLHEKTGTKVYASVKCAQYVSKGDLSAISLDSAIKAGLYPSSYKFRSCLVEPLIDGEKFTIGRTQWTAIDTPGHCSGHMCYLMETIKCKYLFSGDSFFTGGRISLQNIWDCSIPEYAASADKLCKVDFDALLPSHFGIDMSTGKVHVERAARIFSDLMIPPQAN